MKNKNLELRAARLLTPVPGDPPHNMQDLRDVMRDLVAELERIAIPGRCDQHSITAYKWRYNDCVKLSEAEAKAKRETQMGFYLLYREALKLSEPKLAEAIETLEQGVG